MLEIRVHGRGGQGAVVASEILATAFFKEGKSVQTFPEFGVERRGAPVMAYIRVDRKPIRLRCKIYQPDYIIVLDPVLLQSIDVTVGLKNKGRILINSNLEAVALHLPTKFRLALVDATHIALKHKLGSRTAPIVNTTILGACSKLPGMPKLKFLKEAIRGKIKIKAETNLTAAQEAYDSVVF